MAQRIVRDHEADFPITCESCLGDNPYVQMTREGYAKECKICIRSFTVFRWRPGRNARYKKTEICQTCSKLKNLCQVCLLDLEFGLPVQVRDTTLNITTHDSIPKSNVNREYFAEEHDRKRWTGLYLHLGRCDLMILFKSFKEQHHTMKRTDHIFVVNTSLVSVQEVPNVHTDMRCAKQESYPTKTLKIVINSVNDPVAMKLLGKAGEMGSLEPPEDASIKTLYLGGLNSRILEQDHYKKTATIPTEIPTANISVGIFRRLTDGFPTNI
ncbi:unnamed protein product [Arabis nemorensis]|uniref:STL11/RBM22-like N-terminal domain-containing protein n=1 Tax=Arabis nemorensis TaxID=586526 RepID=A0A565CI19_9BRAS|nr:unnamed protein product [Arabis nemorensis]